MDELQEGAWEDHIQVSADQSTVWVHTSTDGSTVGRFSRRFGIDVHTTATEQLQGAPQCLNCTHEPAGRDEWETFIALMQQHHGIPVPSDLISFGSETQGKQARPMESGPPLSRSEAATAVAIDALMASGFERDGDTADIEGLRQVLRGLEMRPSDDEDHPAIVESPRE